MRTFVFAATLLSVSGLAQGAKPGSRAAKQYTIEQFMATTSIGGGSLSPDEKLLLVTSDASGVPNVYTIPVAGGPPKPVTQSLETTSAVSFFPKDERILYTRDQGGNENNHLFVRELDGKDRDLTPGQKLKAQFGGWSHDDQYFYVQTNERDPRYFDLYRYDVTGYARTLLYKNEGGYFLSQMSDDGRWLTLSKLNSNVDSDVFVCDLSAKESKRVSVHTGAANYSPAGFDRASKMLYYLTNDGSEFERLARYDLQSGQKEEVEQAPWDINFNYFSWNGRYRVLGINQDARTVIKVYDTASGRPVALPKLPEGELAGVSISRSEQRMVFAGRSDRSPNNLYVYEFGSKKLTRLTDTLSKQIDAKDLVDSQIIRFKGFDDMPIPAIFYKPKQASATHKAPALVYVHGGPGGQTRPGYSPAVQYLVNHGYVILGINNRGSSGYGKTFFHADDRKHGREPLWDCVSAKTYLASLPYVDPDKIGIMGGSYGGYMVLAALAFRPEVFAVGVDLFGVANWFRTLNSIPSWWEAQRQMLYTEIGDPVKDKKMLEENSPLLHADQIRKPLLVAQGANDPRVIKAESEDMVAAVRKNGVPVDYVVFPDEGHGFRKKKNEITAYRAVLEFLDKYLKRASGSAELGAVTPH